MQEYLPFFPASNMSMHLLAAYGLQVLMSLGSGLAVETATPDALCPDVEMTRSAVTARLGILDSDGSGWRAVYSAGHAPEKGSGDFVRLELFDPKGTLRLRRDLPRGSEPCAAMAQVIALVIERFFRTLPDSDAPPAEVDASRSAGSGASRRPSRRPADAGSPPADAGSADAGSPPSGSASRQPPIVLLAGVGGTLLFPDGAPAPELRLQARMTRSVEAGIRMALPVSRVAEPIGVGNAYLRSLPIRLGVGWVGELLHTQFAFGPEVLFSVEHGWTEDIPHTEAHDRLVLGLGLQLEMRYWFTHRIGIVLTGGADAIVPLAGSRFVVSGQDVLVVGDGRGFSSVGLLIAWSGEAWSLPH